MGDHDPAQPPRTGAEKMKKIGDKAQRTASKVQRVGILIIFHNSGGWSTIIFKFICSKKQIAIPILLEVL
jgi:hypothetical protein